VVRRLAAGPLVAALEARFEARGQAGLRLVVMLYADSPIVRCILDVENRATWHRLRARVPLGLAGSVALAGTAFGSVARAPVAIPATAYPLETPVRTAPAHGFVAAASRARGVGREARPTGLADGPAMLQRHRSPDGRCLALRWRRGGEERAPRPSRRARVARSRPRGSGTDGAVRRRAARGRDHSGHLNA